MRNGTNPQPADEGELIVESLFVETRPTSAKTNRLQAEAEDAEVTELTVEQILSEEAPRISKSAKPGFFDRLKSSRAAAKASKHEAAQKKAETKRARAAEASATRAEKAAMAVEATPTEAARGGLAPAGADQKTAKKSRKVKKKADKSASKSFSFARRSVAEYLQADLGAGRITNWKLTRAGLESIEEVPAGAKVMSFSELDRRFEVDAKQSNANASAILLGESDEPMAMLNRSADLKALYATPKSRVEGLGYKLGPSQLLVDRIVRSRSADDQALVIALGLKDARGQEALLVLIYRSATGRVSAPQISFYPDNREFLLAQFAAANQAVRESAQVLQLDGSALLSEAGHLLFYPGEGMAAGLPVRQLWQIAAVASVVGASWASYTAREAYEQKGRLRTQVQLAQTEAQSLRSQVSSLLEGSPRRIGQLMSLDAPALVAQATYFWRPGARVRLTSDGFDANYLLSMAMPEMSRARSGGTDLSGSARMRILNNLPMPNGCEAGSIFFSGNLNEAQLNIRCEIAVQPLSRYRD